MASRPMEMILSRRTIRKYTTELVKGDDVKTMLEAAMAAPSHPIASFGISLLSRTVLDNLARAHPYGKVLFEAPLCIAVCGDTSVPERF